MVQTENKIDEGKSIKLSIKRSCMAKCACRNEETPANNAQSVVIRH